MASYITKKKKELEVLKTRIPSVLVVLGYYNGEKYIYEQLESLEKQTGVQVNVQIFDDCSSEKSSKILARKAKLILKTTTYKIHRRCPRLGFSKNFISALGIIPKNFDFYAYSDQDDIWDATKLQEAVKKLTQCKNKGPQLYCSRTKLKYEDSKKEDVLSTAFAKKPSFENALVQNIGGGNTMVFNRSAKSLIYRTSKEKQLPAHDWWSYIIVSGSGGTVIYDKNAYIKYRQHENNTIGQNLDLSSQITRLKFILKGGYKSWIDVNLETLSSNQNELSLDATATLNKFMLARKFGHFLGMFYLFKSKIYRQTIVGSLALYIANFLGML